MSQMRHDYCRAHDLRVAGLLAYASQPMAAPPPPRYPCTRMPGNGASPARTQMAVSGHLRHSSSRCAIAVDRLAAAMRARRMSPPSGKTRKRGVRRSCCCGCACAAAAVFAALMLLRLRSRCCSRAFNGLHGCGPCAAKAAARCIAAGEDRCGSMLLFCTGIPAGDQDGRFRPLRPRNSLGLSFRGG